ncbi:hypothetical protein INT43_007647 [Umbelopsis isabellina]|uniref:Uncharacterized protein n=1 Tax=Mortierella isabellina TaxID=91625 RepID=A0A8H7UEI8_MORIS|nr:hypothetical protein INT43_007647 [Umbelopsis isabellina]
MAPLQVIGSGWGRTGTAAMREALATLGYDVHHMIVIMSDPNSDKQTFIDAWEGKEVDWNKPFDKFNAAVDWPSSTFYKQLMEVYPDAKVIHTTRDAEAWYKSCKNTILPVASEEMAANIPPHVAEGQKMVREVVWEGEMQGKMVDKEAAVQMFRDHDEEVKRIVPSDRLLVFETGKDGWEKLCTFLEKDIPDTPWPHINKTDDFRKHIKSFKSGEKLEGVAPVPSS